MLFEVKNYYYYYLNPEENSHYVKWSNAHLLIKSNLFKEKNLTHKIYSNTGQKRR